MHEQSTYSIFSLLVYPQKNIVLEYDLEMKYADQNQTTI